MLVHKFGGTSVGSGERMQAVARIVAANRRPAVVVTSAMSGVTDGLIALARLAQRRETAAVDARFAALRLAHVTAAEVVTAPGADREALLRVVRDLLLELDQVLHGVRLLQELSPRSLDLISSLGERLAAPLLAAALRQAGLAAEPVDARDVIRTDAHFGAANVDLETSRLLARERLLALAEHVVPVVTGFLAAAPDGAVTTLGRGGSDYSAALVGAFLDAEAIWIWTDVDGAMTADPRVVPEARVLEAISYREAAEMAYFGSKVLHPSTMIPAVHQDIPIRVRNTFNPDAPGTLITSRPKERFEGVKTVTSIAGMAMVTVEGRGMIGVPGVVGRLFSATARAGISVYMISQASSEQNISFLVPRTEGERAVAEVSREFELELARGRIDRVDVQAPVGILAIIGEGMRGTPGVSQKLFTALGRGGVNVLAIAQGSSELNVSVVVDEQDLGRAVGAVHTRFGLTRTTHVLLLGRGLIARTLLKQLLGAKERLSRDHGLRLSVIGVTGQTEWLFDPLGIDDERLRRASEGAPLGELGGAARPADAELLEQVARTRRLDIVLVDATAAETGPLHEQALVHGLHVVSANKKPLAGPLPLYRAIRQAAAARGLDYRFEVTFGAGLPVLSTLQELLATHDRIIRISGCFSGTLGLICSMLDEGTPFSRAVAVARERGFTEPDPRDDLSGMDVARKALIIAREIGLAAEMQDVAREALVPPDLMALPDVEAFMARLPELDAAFAARAAAAAAAGQVLRYLAEITAERVAVGLTAVDRGSAAGQLTGPDNILVYRTERYDEHPLVIRGPGAGAEVTAAGVFGDLLKVAHRVG
ncbi:MAG TPA: bifunctional aspartate kinase/homoserine dehydrogenase I [Polyangia bacterium]|jgi:aspartokinase/homoserine dehydrogenase 1